jgi:transposase-like protein
MRLAKFRGLSRATLRLHLKECEFRFNHRRDNSVGKATSSLDVL